MVKDEYSPFSSNAAWFMQRSAYPLSDAHPERLEPIWAARRARNSVGNVLDWKCAGPYNIAGRVTTLIAHPADPKKLYAGTAGGGVWRTTAAGTWEPCWPDWLSPHIGALAFDPGHTGTIYCGTGEANGSPYTYPGSGLVVTHDGGDHWELLADAGNESLPRRIGALYPDPHKPGRILIGGIQLIDSQFSGLYWSDDGGKSWQRENEFSLNSYWCHAIVSHPDGTIFAALNLFGPRTGVWRKRSEGWQRLGKNMPGGDLIGRISLAMAPTEPHVLYALVGDRAGQRILGVYRSRDLGESWTPIGGKEFVNERQSVYNNTIAVHPADSRIVVCGVTDLHISRDGGDTWTQVSQGNPDAAVPAYVHSDHHALVLPGGNLIYAAGDGGVFASEDLGNSWTPCVREMCNAMFYSIDVAPENGKLMCGGTQDNGTLLTVANGRPGDWMRVIPGDGAWSAFHPRETTHVYGTRSGNYILYHTAAEHWGQTRGGIKPRKS